MCDTRGHPEGLVADHAVQSMSSLIFCFVGVSTQPHYGMTQAVSGKKMTQHIPHASQGWTGFQLRGGAGLIEPPG